MKLAPIERRTFRCTQNHFFCSGNFNIYATFNFENLTFNSFFKFLSMINPVSSSILFKMKLLPSLDMY